eukprot:403351149
MLTCKACQKIYNTTTRQPQVMVCGHSICLQCFQEYEQQEIQIQDEKYQCPIKDSCQQTQISKIVATYILDLLQDAEIFNIFCDKHPKNTAQYFCKQDNLLICETCILTQHSNHLKPQEHVHFNSESKEIFTRKIIPFLRDKKKRLDAVLESFELSQGNEQAFSATKYQNLFNETIDVLYDKQVIQELDLTIKQILVTQEGKTPQADVEEMKEHEEIDQKFQVLGNLPQDQGFEIKINDQVYHSPIQKFRDLVDKELNESFLLHTAFGNQFDIEYQLLYRGTEDGFTDTMYKRKCCFAPNIIIFVLSEFGQVFGGFVSEILQKRSGPIQDRGAFLFQLTKRQIMFQNGKHTNALSCSRSYILAFGSNQYINQTRKHLELDLLLSNNCDQNTDSSSSLGNSYLRPEGEEQQFLAGEQYFKVFEIEAYQAKFNLINL